MSENSKIVKEIQDYCVKYDIKANAFAKKTGISQATISRILNGKFNPSMKTIIKLEQVLKSRESPKSSLSASKIKLNPEYSPTEKSINKILPVIGETKNREESQLEAVKRENAYLRGQLDMLIKIYERDTGKKIDED